MRLLVATFLIVAVAAAATPTDHTPVEDTTCWECHRPGLWAPHLDPPQLVEYRFEPAGDAWEIVAVLDNPWHHELNRVFGIVGLSGTGLSPMEGASSTIQRSGSVPGLLDAGPTTITLDLPAGTQAVQVRLESKPLHELELIVHPGGLAPWAGPYGPEDLAAAGWTGWIFEVHRHDLLPDDARFELTVEADGSANDRLLVAAPPAPPGGQTEIRWPVTSGPGAGHVTFKVLAVMEYDHMDASIPDVGPTRIHGSAHYDHDGATSFKPEQTADASHDIPGFPAVGVLAGIAAWLRRSPVPYP